jgi:SSS family solute:Na+ symporter
MPVWFTALFMVTMLAAAMSTLSAQFHTMGSAFGRDFIEQGINIKTRSTILTTKISMGFAIIISTLLAYFLPRFFEQGSAIIAIGTAIFMGLCAATFLPLYFGGLFTRRITKAGALAGFFSGLATSSFWIMFMHAKESAPLGLCKAFFGVPTLAGQSSLQFVDPIVVALPVSIVVTIMVSIFTKSPDSEHLERCFSGLR